MVKKFTIPFASQGDANDIPDALQVDGKVSFTQGFGYDYERPYDDPQAKDIAREDMNGLFKAITSAIGELQTLGASGWSSAVAYPKGAIVYFEKDLYISQVDDNQNEPPQNWVSITSIANDSLKKAANLSDLTNKATARSNLGLGSSATLNKTDTLGTSTNLVATQKLVNDTKINLDNSKQDKLTFVGSGKVMREGAYGIGGVSVSENSSINKMLQNGFYLASASADGVNGDLGYTSLISFTGDEGFSTQIGRENLSSVLQYRAQLNGEWSEWDSIYATNNTTTDKSGFLRARGSANALTDQNNQQIGVGQRWVNVTSQRATNTIYQNTTGKPISVYMDTDIATGGYMEASISPDGPWVRVGNTSRNAGAPNSFIVPVGAYYRTSHFLYWSELR